MNGHSKNHNHIIQYFWSHYWFNTYLKSRYKNYD